LVAGDVFSGVPGTAEIMVRLIVLKPQFHGAMRSNEFRVGM
jgi:hypothetical protein